MGKQSKGSAIEWTEAWPWLEQLSECGIQPRVVITLINRQTMRVVVTCRRRDGEGVWSEVLRLGEDTNTIQPGAAVQVVIRVCARLLGEIETSVDTGDLPPSYVVPVPLPDNPTL